MFLLIGILRNRCILKIFVNFPFTVSLYSSVTEWASRADVPTIKRPYSLVSAGGRQTSSVFLVSSGLSLHCKQDYEAKGHAIHSRPVFLFIFLKILYANNTPTSTHMRVFTHLALKSCGLSEKKCHNHTFTLVKICPSTMSKSLYTFITREFCHSI